MPNSFLPDLEADIFPERKYLKSDKLLTKLLAKTLAHTTKKLHSDNAILFVGVVMCHLDDMP